jgi:hypothetical protein
MLKNKSFNWFITAMMVLATITFIGCEKKAEDSRQTQEEVKSETISPDSTSSVATEGEPGNENTIQIPDLKGTWVGTFDKRTTTLTITEQTDSSFSGKISIKYRETINQDVKGTFRPATQNVSMVDQIHSKYMGKYNGKLSDDGKNLSGTFTMNRDGTKSSFNLNKK